MEKLKIIDIAIILNLVTIVLNICIALYQLINKNIDYMIFNVGCAICSGIIAIICAILKNK